MDAEETRRPDRQAIRNWIATHQKKLIDAQIGGYLARIKLDIRDEFEQKNLDNDKEAALNIFKQELEAFCSDMKLASFTVKQEVQHTNGNAKWIVLGLVVLVLIIVVVCSNS